MQGTLWDLRQVKEQREEMAREIGKARLARNLRDKKGGLRALVTGLLWKQRSRGSSFESPRKVRRAGKTCEESSQTARA